MHIFHKLPAALMAAAFILLAQNVQAGPGWPAVYDPKTVLNLNLDMSNADWSTVRNDTTFDIEVPAMFWADGEEPILISVRRKSATALGDKVSLKLDINEYVDQKWNDVKKLSLENGDDADVIAEGYAWYLNRVAAASLDSGYTPGLAAWVRLFVNGEYLGVYLNLEHPDKTFLKNRGLYTKNETWLYKAGEIWEDHRLKVGEPDSPTTALLCYSPFATNDSGGGKKGGGKGKKGGGDSTTCATSDSDSAMATELNKLIDMEGMLTQGAVSAFTLGNDALFSKGKNFLYIDALGGEKRRYIPWDLDSVFVPDLPVGSIYGTEKRKRGQIVLNQTPYQEVILNNPTFRVQYDQIMTDLLNGPLQIDAQIAFLNDMEVLLGSALEADSNNNLKVSVPARFEVLREWMRGRVININEQLDH
jgi:hypothetical protein